MGAALLIAIWAIVLGYALIFHGISSYNGSALTLRQALFGSA